MFFIEICHSRNPVPDKTIDTKEPNHQVHMKNEQKTCYCNFKDGSVLNPIHNEKWGERKEICRVLGVKFNTINLPRFKDVGGSPSSMGIALTTTYTDALISRRNKGKQIEQAIC